VFADGRAAETPYRGLAVLDARFSVETSVLPSLTPSNCLSDAGVRPPLALLSSSTTSSLGVTALFEFACVLGACIETADSMLSTLVFSTTASFERGPRLLWLVFLGRLSPERLAAESGFSLFR
tara:strand:+ start:370 stop:738 length:369 start_codon:yes stop_codon:yes gene_type:complete